MQRIILAACLAVLGVAVVGCNELHRPVANCGWTMRAQSRVEMQEDQLADEEYFAQYERNFIANELKYYRTEPEWDRPDGTAYALQASDNGEQGQASQ
jgi:hypothetical protein